MGAATAAAGSFLILSSLATLKCTSGKTKRPNVVLVMTDDQGYGDIGAHSSPYVKTPTLDQLHAESIRLTNFHVDPCCSPTRAALMTGLYSARTGVWHTIGGRSLLRQDKVTMADVFKSGGYRTALFGKWHLGDNYPFRPQDRGFDEALTHRNGSVANRWDYWGNDYYDDTYGRNGRPEKFSGYCNTVWFDEAIRFIRENRGNPFFCFLSTNIPHAPLHVDERYAEPYRSLVSDRLARYYGMITRFDEDLARLLKELRDLELEDNTIFIFMTDNGPCPWYGGIIIDEDGFVEEGYSAGMRGGKIWGYENAHRVPFFIRWPSGGLGGGRDEGRLAAHIDLLPTLIEYCGLDAPGGANFDGRSLAPLLSGQGESWPERTLLVHNQRVDFPEKYKDYQVLTERWRLIKRGGEELYDITRDPGQRQDVAQEFPEVVGALHREYEDWWEDVSRDFHIYDAIVIGSENENPMTLFGHDAHRSENARLWVVQVEEDGEYRFQMSRWPKEADKPIVENRAGNETLPLSQAHLTIGSIEAKVDITPEDKSASFIVHLKAGQTCLEAWFSEEETQKDANAEFVSVERLGPADPAELEKYRASDPDRILRQ